LLLLYLSVPVFGATEEEFYENLYRRGLTHFQMQAYDIAIRELRIAAFGFLEKPAKFETAQAYIVASAEHLNRAEDARTAMHKIVSAEHVKRSYASLDIPADVRAATEKATALLPKIDLAYLRAAPPEAMTSSTTKSTPAAPPPQPESPSPKPQPQASSFIDDSMPPHTPIC